MKQSDKNNHYYHDFPTHLERFGFFANTATQHDDIMPSYHAHFHYEILYIASGAKEIIVNNAVKYTLDSTCIALMKPHLIHQVRSASSNNQQRVLIQINTELMEEFCKFASPHIADCFNIPVLKLSAYSQKMLNYLVSSLVSLSPDSPHYSMKGKVLLSNLLLLLTDELDAQSITDSGLISNSEQEYANKIAEYIAKNYHKPITISDLGKMLHFSKTHVSRIFKNSMNTTLHKYLVGVRIINAKEMLFEDNASVYSVAYKCGFNSPEAFARAFRQHMGCSPTEYVKLKNKTQKNNSDCH